MMHALPPVACVPSAEAGAIGCLLQRGYCGDPEIPAELDGLPLEAWYDPRCRDIWRAVLGLRAQGQPATDATWIQQWQVAHHVPPADSAWLLGLATSAGPDLAGYVAAMRRTLRQRLLRASLEAIGAQEWESPEAMAEAMREAVEGVEPEHSGLTIYDGGRLRQWSIREDVDLVGPRFLGPGDLAVWAGAPKTGKTMMIMDAVCRWCAGRPWHGLTVGRPLTVAILQVEISAARYAERLQRLDLDAEAREAICTRLLVTERCQPDLADHGQARAFARLVRARLGAPPDLLVIDPLANLYTGRSENDNAEMGACLGHLRAWQRACGEGTGLIVVHHARKQGREDDRHASPFDRLRGAGALRGAYDSGVMVDLGGQTEDDPRRRLHFELRNGPPLPRLVVEWRDGGYVAAESAEAWAKAAPAPGYARDKAILDLLSQEWTAGRRHSGRSLARLADERKILSDAQARRAIQDLMDACPARIRRTDTRLPSGSFAIEVA